MKFGLTLIFLSLRVITIQRNKAVAILYLEINFLRDSTRRERAKFKCKGGSTHSVKYASGENCTEVDIFIYYIHVYNTYIIASCSSYGYQENYIIIQLERIVMRKSYLHNFSLMQFCLSRKDLFYNGSVNSS